MDVAAYLQRLNDPGPAAPTMQTLQRLHLAHLQHVPFENLDIHLGRPISLEPQALFEKIVLRRRGGFCYELNGLFARLLREIGFEVTLLSARVADGEGGYGPPFDHLTLRVVAADEPQTPWLADVGFGDGFLHPLRLDRLQQPQPDALPGRAYRLDPLEDGLVLRQRREHDSWQNQYQFTLQAHELDAFTAMCLYHQTSPASHFTQRRVCTLATARGRITLSDQKFIVTEAGRRLERPLADDEYDRILADVFGIRL